MLRKCKQFLVLPIKKQLFILELFLFLVLAKTCIRLLSFSFLSKYLFRQKHSLFVDEVGEKSPLIFQDITNYLNILTKHIPWNSVCLDQALATRWLLGRRNIATKLYFGVMKDKNKQNGMKAHAWLMAGDYCVTGHGYELYNIINVY